MQLIKITIKCELNKISSLLIETHRIKKVSPKDLGPMPLVAVVMGSDSDLPTLNQP